ncbi:MAG: hypothetical protein WAM47_14700 [Candidatus Sulfotelmatobacter sp.]
MPPTPTAQEYHRSIAIRQELLYPYWVAASLITFAGCGLTTLLVRLAKPRRSRPFLAPAATTFVLLLAIAALSDVGIAFHLWAGPRIYAATFGFVLVQVMLPMSLLAGLLAFIRRGFDT